MIYREIDTVGPTVLASVVITHENFTPAQLDLWSWSAYVIEHAYHRWPRKDALRAAYTVGVLGESFSFAFDE